MTKPTELRKKFKARVERDSWNIDTAFYKWLYPRLDCLLQRNTGYPENRGSLENWQSELKEKLDWLKFLAKVDSHDSHRIKNYINIYWNNDEIMKHCSVVKSQNRTLTELREIANSSSNPVVVKEMYVSDALHYLFGEWFGKNYGDLWW